METVIVEDWTQQQLNSRGVPDTWTTYETTGGHPAYDFAVVAVDDRRALRVRSHGDHSTIAKKIHIDLKAVPWLEWNWKVIALPDGADIRQRATSDAAAHVFVVWPRWPRLSPPAPSNHSEVVSKKASVISPRSGWRWR